MSPYVDQTALRSLRQDTSEESLRYKSLLKQAELARLSVIRLLQTQATLERKGQSSVDLERRFGGKMERELEHVMQSLPMPKTAYVSKLRPIDQIQSTFWIARG